MESKGEKTRPSPNVNNDLVEMNLIQLMMEYPQRIAQVEDEKVLDYFLQPEIQGLGKKVIDAYKVLGFIDVGVILSADANSALSKKMYQLMMKTMPTDDKILEKIFTDNVRQIKRKWYKEQHRQIKIKLTKAQESGNEEMMNKLLCEKEDILRKEKEL